MDTTSPSLLIRLRAESDGNAWPRFVELYTPLIYYWARRAGMTSEDASDLVQDVFALLVKKLPLFEYDPQGSFRGWLRTLTLNRWRELNRRKSIHVVDANDSELHRVASQDPPADATDQWDEQYRHQLVSRAIDLAEDQFEPATWRALREYLSSGGSAREVASKHGVSAWTVYSAKSRLLKQVREELEGLLD